MPSVSRCGKLAPMLSSLATPRVPSAFITITRQLPLRTFHVSVCAPAPLTDATQKCSAAGGAIGALLSAVMLAGYSELRAFLHAATPSDGDPIEQLRAYGRAYLEFADQRPGIYRVLFMTKIREGVPVPARGAPSGHDEGVDAFNDVLAIVTRCLPDGPDPFAQSAYVWAGLHGYAALRQAIPAFPWPAERDYVERMIRIHIQAHTGSTAAGPP